MAQMLMIPVEELWERVPGATQDDVARWREARERGDSLVGLERLLARQAADFAGV